MSAAAAASAGAAVASCTGAEGGFFFLSGGSVLAGAMGPEEGSGGALGAVPGALPPPSGCRGCYQLLLSGKALADRYRKIYTAALSDRELGGHPGR